MKTAGFIGHSFHKKTKSDAFIKNILKENYKIVEFYDESWNFGKSVDINKINKNNFNVVVYFQFIHPYSELKKIKCKNIIWIPMFDSEVKRNYFSYFGYLFLGVKIISFSKKLFDKIRRIGFECIYLQYFLDPTFLVRQPVGRGKDNKNNVFFWQRVDKINWKLVKKIIGNNKIDKVIFKSDCDPGHKSSLPSYTDIKKYNMQIIDGWLEKSVFFKLLSSCNIFIASRQFEGIGMAFLEAMALGMCVIAADSPTMNEYIISGKNGYLYDFKKPQMINFSDCKIIGQQARHSVKCGFNRWKIRQEELLNFLELPKSEMSFIRRLYLGFAVFWYNILSFLFVFAKKMIKKLLYYLR